ncbi:MAG: prepilin-type N-terminal cleavage/methylation domain-containing protein [Vicinamibacterales bacterium]
MTNRGERGFSLIEAVVAVSLLAVGVSAGAQLTVAAGRAVSAAQQADVTRLSAREKLEQLRSLVFSNDDGVGPMTDAASDVSVTPQLSSGGPGLVSSAPDTLLTNVAGFCDFLDARGVWIAGGTRPPSGAIWVRRWSIQAMPGLPDTILLQVVVVPAHIVGNEPTLTAARSANAAWLVDVVRGWRDETGSVAGRERRLLAARTAGVAGDIAAGHFGSLRDAQPRERRVSNTTRVCRRRATSSRDSRRARARF